MSPSAGQAQIATDDETVVTEIVAISGQELDGQTLGGFLPVVIGGEGDLLFLSQSDRSSFITYDGNLNIIANAIPTGQQNVVRPSYSIDSFGDNFALRTNTGIFTGSVSDNMATGITIAPALAELPARDQGNFSSGANPLILNRQTALLVSDVGVTEPDGSFFGNTENFVFFAGANDLQFSNVFAFDGATSLNFAGAEGLFASTSALLSSPNSAQASNLALLDLNNGAAGIAEQVGPNGSPQLVNGGFTGGDLAFAGFTFVDNTGGNFIGSGANFDSRGFSANSVTEAFVLGNALVAIDGGPGDSIPAELLVFDDQVVAVASNIRLGVGTSLGEVAFRAFEDVILAENDDLIFSADTSQTNGQPLANEVGLWRVIDPGRGDQAIVPILTVGDELIISASGLTDLFPNAGSSVVTVAGFDTANISLSQGNAIDGRPGLVSVNQQGHVATVVQINGANGPVAAIVAQDDNGDFHVVTFIGQVIDVDGQGDLRTVTNFTAQFGSNDIDGAGDLFSVDEQLGFIVTLDRADTVASEFDQAIFRVSLNGIEMVPITDFLWRGGCGDDEFFTLCTVNGTNGSNWVNADDPTEESPDAPGDDPGQHTATVRGADVRISLENVDLARLDSDSTITLQDSRTLTLRNGGDINRLIIERGTLIANGQLDTDRLQLDFGTITANAAIMVEDALVFSGGRIEGVGGITLDRSAAISSTPSTAMLSGNLVLATSLHLLSDSDVTIDTATLDIDEDGLINLDQGSDLTIIGSTITGEGGVFVDGKSSSITSQGLNFINAPLVFLNANSVRDNDAEPDFIHITSSSLTLKQTLFAAQDLSGVAVNQGAGIALDPGTTLDIAEGGSLIAQTFVEFKQTPGTMGDGAVTVNFRTGSNLEIGTLGTALFNLGDNGTANLNAVNVTGGGLLANLSNLTVTNSNLAVVIGNIGSATFAGNNTIETSEGAATLREEDQLFQRGVELATGVDIGAAGDPVFVSALLNDVTYTGGMNAIFGDGAAFLIDNTLEGGRLDVSPRVLIANDLTLNNQAIFSASGSAGNQTAFAVLATAPDETFDASATFKGNGFALLDFSEIQGLIAPNNPQFQFANLTNELGSEFLAANPDALMTTADVDPTPGGFLQVSDSSISQLTLVNNGSARLENATFLRDGAVFNTGLLKLVGPVFDVSQVDGESTAFITNDDDGRLQLSGTETVGVTIGNTGLITVSGAAETVTLEELLTQGDADVFGFQAVTDGATLTVNDTDALSVSGDIFAGGNGEIGAKWFVDDATVRLLGEDADVPFIDTIDASGDVEIEGTGKINNLDANGSGLRTVNGIFIGSGGFNGGDIDIGTGGGLAFQTDSQFEKLNIAGGGELNVEAAITFTDADVEGFLIADRLSGTSLVLDGLEALVDVSSIPLDSSDFAIEVDTLNLVAGSSLIYRGTIDADSVDVSGTITPDDAAGSTLVESIQADNIVIRAGGFVAAEELIAEQALTIEQTGRFMQLGEGTLEVNNLELDGVLTGETILIAGDLQIGESGVLQMADSVDVAGGLTVDGILSANILRTNIMNMTNQAGITIGEFFSIEESVLVEGDIGLFDDDDELDPLFPQGFFGGDVTISETGSLSGEGQVSVDGTLTAQEGSLIIFDGAIATGEGADFQGAAQIGAFFNAEGDVTISNDVSVTGSSDGGEISGFGELIRESTRDFFESEEDDYAFGSDGDVTVEGSGSLAVDGGLFATGNFDIGDGATVIVEGPAIIDGLSTGAGSNTQLTGGANINGDAGVSGTGNFGQTVVVGDMSIEGSFGFTPQTQLDQSSQLEPAAEAGADLADSVSGTIAPGSFDFNSGPFALGTFGALDIGAGSNVAVGGDSFVGGTFTNGGDADFAGDLLTGFDADDEDIGFLNDEGASFELVGGLGIAGNFQNFGDINVDGDIAVDGDSLNEGTVSFTGSWQHSDGGTVENNGTIIGGRPETQLDLGSNYDLGANVINRGIFGGRGTINGDLVQESQADNSIDLIFSPGFSPGIINITGDATFNDGIVLFEIGGLTPGTDHDQINVGGNLTIGSNAMIVIDLLELDDGSGIFLPQTGDDIVIFTAADISPDEVEQINFSVIDDLPLGFTLVPEIGRNSDGEIFRVLRGFNGSQLASLSMLDPAQLAVAGAVDFLSTAESGVPSPELFQLAVDLQFTDERAVQLESLTAMSSTTMSAIQSSAMRSGSIGLDFAESRLDHNANGLRPTKAISSARSGQGAPALRAASGSGGSLDDAALATTITRHASHGGGWEHLGGDGSVFRLIGSTAYRFGSSASGQGTIGFDYDGWSANAGVEFEDADGVLLLGANLALGSIDADLDNMRGSVESDSFAATIYGQYQTGSLALAAGYSIADLDIDSTRQVLGATATGETSGEVQHLFSRLGYHFFNTPKWRVGPEVSVVHTALEIDGFSETGAGVFDLTNAALDRDSTRLSLLANAARQFDTGMWSGLFTVSAGYQWALSGDEFATVASAFSLAPATSFANPLRPLQNSGVDLATELSMTSASGVNIALGYSGLWGKTGEDVHEVSAKVSVVF